MTNKNRREHTVRKSARLARQQDRPMRITKTLIRIIPLRKNTEKAADKQKINPGTKLSRGSNKRSENPTLTGKKKGQCKSRKSDEGRVLLIRTATKQTAIRRPECLPPPVAIPGGASVTGEAWTRPGVKVKTGTRRT